MTEMLVWGWRWISSRVNIVFVLVVLGWICDAGPAVTDSTGPIVTTDKGRVRGIRYKVKQFGVGGDAFLGIPYAQPPLGHRRFRYPEPIHNWNTILDATRLPNSCHQVPDIFFGPVFPGSNMWNPNTPVSEDCLYLNVWVPDLSDQRTPRIYGSKEQPKLAVIVWIFGGGFYSGTTTLEVYDGQILASLHNVVVVSIGYRVGALGFLCLNHSSAPCNVGLFDQLSGLEWVQQNIAQFGGDPKNVTLFGESAGSVSVSLHLLSPLSRDKFHRAILQSGTANMPWAVASVEEAQRRSRDLATEYLTCEKTDNMKAMSDCLRGIEATTLVDSQWVSRGILQFPFLPVVDNIFLREDPIQTLRHGRFKRCPILIGSNHNEGSWFLIYELSDQISLNRSQMSRGEFVTSLKSLFNWYPMYRQEMNSSFALEAINFQYTDWLNPNDTDSNLGGLDNAIGDSSFVCPLNQFAYAYAAVQPVYTYYFTERYSSNPWPRWMGVLHGDEVLFTFGQVLKPGTNFTEHERRLSRKIMQYWTNFAQFGTPNQYPGEEKPRSEWPLHMTSTRKYLTLNSRFLDLDSSKAVGQGPRANYCAFWLDHLPTLRVATANIHEKEKDWKLRFHEWSTRYIVDWKSEHDRFLEKNKGRCDGK